MKSAFKTGDVVKILSGNDKGKSGKVIKINREKGVVLVEGIFMQTHFTKKSDKNPNGGMIKKEGFLNISKVKKVEGAADKAAKTEKKAEKTEKAPKKSLSK